MQRVSVVGTRGAGKTTLARRRGVVLEAPMVELDALHYLPDWAPMPADELRNEVASLTSGTRWVIDGNHSVVRDLVWGAADTVV